MKYILMPLNDLFCSGIAFINDTLYFLINHSCNTLAITSGCVCQVASDKYFIVFIIITYQSDLIRHTKLYNHGFCQTRCLFDILRSSGCNVVKHLFFCYTSAKRYRNILQHLALCIIHLITFRKRHCITAGSSGRDDRHAVNRSDIRQYMEQDRMSRLMISCNLLLFFGNDVALLLRTNSDFDKCSLNVILFQVNSLVFRRKDCRFVQKILQVCSCKSRCCLRNLFQINLFTERFAFGMDFQDLLTSLYIRSSNHNFTVKSSRT